MAVVALTEHQDRLKLQMHVAELFSRLFRASLAPWLELQLTMPQLKMLLVADSRGPAPMGQLAEQLRISVSAATGLVDRLVEQDLAGREHDARDRRVVLVSSTAAGQALVQRLQANAGAQLATALEQLSFDDLSCCARLMESINRSVDGQFQADYFASRGQAQGPAPTTAVGSGPTAVLEVNR